MRIPPPLSHRCSVVSPGASGIRRSCRSSSQLACNTRPEPSAMRRTWPTSIRCPCPKDRVIVSIASVDVIVDDGRRTDAAAPTSFMRVVIRVDVLAGALVDVRITSGVAAAGLGAAGMITSRADAISCRFARETPPAGFISFRSCCCRSAAASSAARRSTTSRALAVVDCISGWIYGAASCCVPFCASRRTATRMDGTRSADADARVGVGFDADADADAAMDSALDADANVDLDSVTRASRASRGSSCCVSFTAPVATGTTLPDFTCFGAPLLAEATGTPCARTDCIDSAPSSATQIVLGQKDREENGSAFTVRCSCSDGSNEDGI